MLRLVDIKKEYPVAGGAVYALKGVSINFRKNEFVSILGASGCGKTTLLNIIGGLDKYTSGDLIINGKSTKQFKDSDWDTYRNHSIGFIFQSYHLIPHQTILQNVELALTIAGVSKEERRRRAIDALDKVGLKDRINNRPNQLSGGQAQRVAIARALINNPEILLADEPTGALDSKTSVQIMELLREISKDRLVIMVTHNPELAEQYSTRIIRLLDGLVTDDREICESLPEVEEIKEEVKQEETAVTKGKKKKSSMSFGMAFMLSLKNLLSKLKRTIMVTFAGSIGIIGVSMVLAISSGVQGYVDGMQDDLLSGNPLTVTQTTLDFDTMMEFMDDTKIELDRLKDKVYVDSLLETLLKRSQTFVSNPITENYISYVKEMPSEYYQAMQFGYSMSMSNNIYTDFKVTNNASSITAENDVSGKYSVTAIRQMYTALLRKEDDYKDYADMVSTVSSFREIPDNYKYVLSQYDVLATASGKTDENEFKNIFEDKDSLIIVLNNNGMTDINLGQYGYFTQEEFMNFAYKALSEKGSEDGERYDESIIKSFIDGKDFDLFVGENAKTFTWYPNDTVYDENNSYFLPGESISDIRQSVYEYLPSAEGFSEKDAVELKVKAIIQRKENVSYGCLNTGIYFTKHLTEYALENAKNSEIVKYINSSENKRLDFLPYTFDYSYLNKDDVYLREQGKSYIMDLSSTNSMMNMFMGGGGNSQGNMITMLYVKADLLGGSDLPKSVRIFPLDFDSKDLITDYLDGWNDMCGAGKTYNGIQLSEGDEVKYTDTAGLIIMMVNTMIRMITIALVAFTALSLVVSTVMVGIITYVSVVERIKEIGILRSVGARKKDIKRLFIAETLIIGCSAGVFGVVVTYILSALINLIVGSLTGIFTIASLPVLTAFIMIVISGLLTLISGIIPASAAAKKDPVVALRTE